MKRLALAGTCRAMRLLAKEDGIAVYVDETGTVWTRPTAYAYAKVCKARARVQEELNYTRRWRDHYRNRYYDHVDDLY